MSPGCQITGLMRMLMKKCLVFQSQALMNGNVIKNYHGAVVVKISFLHCSIWNFSAKVNISSSWFCWKISKISFVDIGNTAADFVLNFQNFFSRNWKVTRMGHIKLGLVNFFAFSNYAIDIGIKLVQIYQKMELHHFRYHQAMPIYIKIA